MKILSWNIWVDGYFDQLKDFLQNIDADIIGLQEVQENDPERNIIGFLTELGYQHVFAMTEHSWGGKDYKIGPALFTKLPIVNRGIFLVNDEVKRAVAWMDIEAGSQLLHVFSVHLAHTHQEESKEQEKEATRLIEKLSSENVIVMGDFNATPESETIKKMKEIVIDTDPASNPTWSVYPEGCVTCNPQSIDTKLDYIFVSKDLKTHSFKVEQSKASDHLPISVVVEI